MILPLYSSDALMVPEVEVRVPRLPDPSELEMTNDK
jgi:hypothetical protein